MIKKSFIKILPVLTVLIVSGDLFAQNKIDTSYSMIAPRSIQDLFVRGKPPVFTLSVKGFFNTGLMDLAANDNTDLSKQDFYLGRNFGTRYGFGAGLIGKIALRKSGYFRLTVSAMYNRFQSNFVIPESPDGKVGYNVFSGALGVENNFTPDRKLKYYIGFAIVGSFISGKAVFATDSTDFDLKILNSFRLGATADFGFELALSNSFGLDFGIKFTHANLFLKDSKESNNPGETYLNDNKVKVKIPYAGWKQFFFTSFHSGFNFYFDMKNK